MVSRIRRLAGLLAIAAAVRWAWCAWRDQVTTAVYPNEWGVRTRPLTAAERDAAIAEELAIARRLNELDSLYPDALGSALPVHGGSPNRPASPA